MSTLSDRHARVIKRIQGSPPMVRMWGLVLGAGVTFDADDGSVVSISIQFRSRDGDEFIVNAAADPVRDAIRDGDVVNRNLMVDVVADANGVGQLFAAYLWTGTTV